MSDWRPLDAELAAWRASGVTPTLWCRDDDATRDTPALRRLLEVAEAHRVPVTLAAIPAALDASLAAAVAAAPVVTVVQHGYAHRNHAPVGERSCELGRQRPLAACVDELAAGRAALESAFGARFVPALVPPWNRIDAGVVAALPAAGFRGLSTFSPRATPRPVEGLTQCNTHVDVIAWRHGRTFIGAERAIARLVEHLAARRAGRVDGEEATGLLTHHLDLGDDAWSFVDELMDRVDGAVRWLAADTLFATPAAGYLRPISMNRV